uniref:Uncharacterized protein n=1 Tax=Aegilops tauschii subsp. strangulata TaxID=200361 RepID=A0A453SKP8_AEGTS
MENQSVTQWHRFTCRNQDKKIEHVNGEQLSVHREIISSRLLIIQYQSLMFRLSSSNA